MAGMAGMAVMILITVDHDHDEARDMDFSRSDRRDSRLGDGKTFRVRATSWELGDERDTIHTIVGHRTQDTGDTLGL